MSEPNRTLVHAPAAVAPDHDLLVRAAAVPDRLRHVVFRPKVASRLRLPPSRHTIVAASSAATGIDPALTTFYETLFARAGLRGDHYRASVLRRRAAACLRAIGEADVQRATDRLAADSAAVERALQAIAIGVSAFFRDAATFDALDVPLRTLAARRRHGLRVLSLGCSDGRELYSVAMRLDALGITPAALHGVDCRGPAIRAARQGRYSAHELEGVSDEQRATYFAACREGEIETFRIHDALRARCHWWVGDAFTMPTISRYDVVLCRNVLIYVTADAAATLWERLRGIAASDGIIVVGKAERPPTRDAFRRVAQGVYVPRSVS